MPINLYQSTWQIEIPSTKPASVLCPNIKIPEKCHASVLS